ncbi:hypothetical protein GCM10010922_03300 [Microbacterium sorbitolivorans]|uniref:Fe-S oxidoreductase n=1 Tax=Microbacterium sorbitolivorans TaxID=1867410 RepID=A0A367Y8Y4_9MICO|nr:hypothetical protein [Microbacterium sorbitolivorans]RCK61512.1 hypothetical protein DTO57_02405 [Microbacterium sorbitolivorans]GGF31566.1 hypothetical protein GCM10010922_03300 [Microbacterium sorbitolivorans]
MQLGTRWRAGDEVPASVPAAIRGGIAEVESRLPADDPASMWTLTFLEGRPIAELDAGYEVILEASGDVTISSFELED